MADNYYKIKETTLTEVANAIRTKTSTTEKVAVNEFADKILGITNTLAGGGGTVEDVNVLPEASVENVGKMYYLTTDQNVYECVEEKNYTFNVGDTITQQLYFDTNIIPEEVFTTNEPVIIMSHDDIALGYVPDLLDDGSTKVLVEEERSGLTIYYIDSTKSLDEINQLFSRAGLVIPHYGWLEDKVRMSDSTSFEITEVDNSSKIVFTKSYQNVQLSAGCADAIDGITEINGVVTFNRQDAELNVRGDTVTIHVKSSDSTVDLSQATGQLDIERIEGSGCTVTANNLSAENIKKDVNILGITGTFEGGTKLNIKYTGNKNEILGNTDHTQLCVNIGDRQASDIVTKCSDKSIGNANEYSPIASQSLSYCIKRFYSYSGSVREDYGSSVIADNDNKKIYVFASYKYSNTYSTKCYCYDIISNTWTTITAPTTGKNYAFYNMESKAIKDGIIYQCMYYYLAKYSIANNTWEYVSADAPIDSKTCIIGDKFYAITTRNIYESGLSTISDIYTPITLSLTGTQYSCISDFVPYGNYIYCFGTNNADSTSSIQYTQQIWKVNVITKQVTKLSITLPNANYVCGCLVGNYYYFVNETTALYRINLENEELEQLNVTLPYSDFRFMVYCNNNLYFIKDGTSGVFMFNIPLNNNELYIFTENGSGYSFELIKDVVNLSAKNVYIGNADNNAELIDAYVYKEDGWYNVNTGEMLLTSEYTPAPSGVYKNIDQLLEYQDNYYVLKDKIDQIDFTSYDSLVASNLIQEEEI